MKNEPTGSGRDAMTEKSTSQKSEKAHIHITGMTCTTAEKRDPIHSVK